MWTAPLESVSVASVEVDPEISATLIHSCLVADSVTAIKINLEFYFKAIA